MAGVAYALSVALKIYVYAIIVWTFGSWFPAWRYQEWWKLLDRIVAPYVSLFYPLKLQMNNIDFTPLVAIVTVEVFRYLVIYAAAMQGAA